MTMEAEDVMTIMETEDMMTMEADMMRMEADMMRTEAVVTKLEAEEGDQILESDVMTVDDINKKVSKMIKRMSEKGMLLPLKEPKKKRPRRIKVMSDEEMMLALKEPPITKFPRCIPPQQVLPPLTPHEQDMLLEDMLSHPEDFYPQLYDTCIYVPAQAPGELSLPEEEAQIRKFLYEELEAKILKQKNEAASSSRNQ